MSLCFGKMPGPDVKRNLEKFCRTVGIYQLNYRTNLIRSAPYLLTGTPLTTPMFYSGAMKKALQKKVLGEDFDLIYIFSSSMAPYALDIEAVPKIMDFIDVDSEKWRDYAGRSKGARRWIYSREARCLRRYEREIEAACRASVLTTSDEVSLFKSFSPEARVFSVGNGVDLKANVDAEIAVRKEKMVFVGVMDYTPNIDAVTWFARDIFPRILRERPDAEFFIVGKNPGREINILAAEIRGVHVTGHVDNVRSFVASSRVVVAPLRIARGIQNKVLEAMAAGVPVVATTPAVKGIEAKAGVDFLLADDSRQFAGNVLRLLDDEALNRKISSNARKLVEEKYDWKSKVAELERVIESIVRGKKGEAQMAHYD